MIVMRTGCAEPLAGPLHVQSRMTREERQRQIVERLHRTAHACEATGELWGRAWATWLRTLLALGYRHDPHIYEIHRRVHLALARKDWHAVLALCSEHNPPPWGRRDA